MKKLLTRRDAIKTGIASLYLLSPASQAEAWIVPVIQLIARIVLGTAVRGTATRAVAGAVAAGAVRTAATRTATATIGRSIAKRALLSTASLAINTGIIAAVSEDVYAQAQENNAKAIWVKAPDVSHTFGIELYSQNDKPVAGNIKFHMIDIHNGNIEQDIPGAYISFVPNGNFKYSFTVSKLLNTGVKKIVGYSNNQYIKCHESENLVIASSDDIEFS